MPFDDDDMTALKEISQSCGYNKMMEQTLTFPPTGPITVPTQIELMEAGTSSSYLNNTDCDLFDIAGDRKSRA